MLILYFGEFRIFHQSKELETFFSIKKITFKILSIIGSGLPF